MSQLALDLIRQAKREGWKSLDLGRTGLTDDNIPDELFELTELEELRFSNQIWDYEKGEWMKNKNEGDENFLSKIPNDIVRLKKLRSLHFGGGFDRLNKWNLSDISVLKEIKYLESINLRGNKISDISILKYFKNLKSLDLSNNNISDISILKYFKNLKSLDLSNNNISDISIVKYLKNLQSLDLSGNGILEISALKYLNHLRSLYLRSNYILDISILKHLNNLENLDLSRNIFSDISPLLPLIRKGINVTLKQYDYLGINLYDCPITTPPVEVVRKSNEAILRYFDQIAESGESKIYEAKLLIVGQPGAGKTTLMNKLLDENHPVPSEQYATKGINVHEGWAFPYTRESGIEYRANLWDFGGQEIQYMAHQYFFTSRSLYVLVADDRKQNASFEYWFRTIHLLGKSKDGQHSPVLVVLNENNHSAITNFDYKGFQEQYPDLEIVLRTVDFSKEDGRFGALRDEIQRMMSHLHHVGDSLPATWVPIREALNTESETHNHITLDRYLEICAQHMDKAHTNFEDYALDLSRYLHDLGIVLHFQDDHSGLGNLVILKPEWAVDAAYSVLQSNDVKKNLGRFTRDFVFDLWKGQGYKKSERDYLLQMLLKDNLEISYETGEAGCGEYIAPQLLPDVPPDYDWSRDFALKFRYRYPFMPPGILTRLIVRMSEFIAEAGSLVWKSGFVLKKEGCRVQVIERETQQGDKVIDIEVIGEERQRKYLLRDVRNEVEWIHRKSFNNLDVELMIPCNCSECREAKVPFFHRYSKLVKCIEKSRLAQCSESADAVSPIEVLRVYFLLEDVEQPRHDTVRRLKRPKPNVFISCSKEDEELQNELEKFLKQLKRKGAIETWSRHNILPGQEWDDETKSQLRKADIMLCLVSIDFMSADYIIDEELPLMLEREKQGLTKVIPVILRPCPWEDTILAKFQALLGRDKPLTLHENQDVAFMEVYNGLKKVIEAG